MKPEIIFEAKPLPSDSPSLILGLQLGYILIDVCAHFLYDAAFQKSVITITDRHTNKLSERILSRSHTTLTVYGREVIDDKTSHVYMSNHQSLFDIPILFASIPGSLRMVAKTELFRVPVLGQALARAGFVEVDRRRHLKAIAQLEQAKDRLKEGISIWISPEGTRTRHPEHGLKPFKKGGFLTAASLEAPIIPMWIDGTDKVIFPDSPRVHPNKHVSVYFGNPISTKGLRTPEIPALMEQVRVAMISLKPIHLHQHQQGNDLSPALVVE